MIEDLQDELPKNGKKHKISSTGGRKALGVFTVWLICALAFILFCFSGIRNTFKNKTPNQVIKEAQDFAQSIQTRVMTLYYTESNCTQVKPFSVNVQVTGAGSYNDAIEGLLFDTPNEALKELCINSIPKGTALISIKLKDSQATIQLSEEFEIDNPLDPSHSLAKQQIIKTVQEINPNISEVIITVNDKIM